MLKRIFRKIKRIYQNNVIKRKAKRLNITYEGTITLGNGIQNWHNTKIIMKNGGRIGDNTILWGGGLIEIGEFTSIGENSWIYSNKRGGVVFGDNVYCAANLYLIDSNHGIKKDEIIRNQPLTSKKIVIGNDVWFGANCTVIPGAYIPDGCVIGACSLVNKRFNPYEVIAGVPAKRIKDRE